MARAAAHALAALAPLDEEHVLPSMDDPRVAVEQAVAVGLEARREGVAAVSRTEDDLRAAATSAIASARAALAELVGSGRIPPPPPDAL